MEKDIRSIVIKAICNRDILEVNTDIRDDANLYDDLGFDSLDVVETEMDIEKELGIRFPDYDYGDFNTVSDLIELTEKLLRDK